MIRSLSILVVGLLFVGVVVRDGTSQEKAPDKKGKSYLPAGWKKLNLSADQKKKIYGVQAEFKTKIKALEEQISQLKTQEHVELVKLLSDAQKAELVKGLVPTDPKKESTEDKKPDDKKK